jgi:hypothetical protein
LKITLLRKISGQHGFTDILTIQFSQTTTFTAIQMRA